MYLEFNVILGIPVTIEISNKAEDCLDGLGFETWYHGSAEHIVGYCGVLLCSFPEMHRYARIENNAFHVQDYLGKSKKWTSHSFDYTADQEREARQLYEALPEKIRKIAPPFGIYIVQSSS